MTNSLIVTITVYGFTQSGSKKIANYSKLDSSGAQSKPIVLVREKLFISSPCERGVRSMMMNRNITRFAWCLLAFLLGAMVALGSEPMKREVSRIDFYALTPQTKILLHTETQVIELTITDPQSGRGVIKFCRDGKQFDQSRPVVLLGATKGQQQGALSLVEMGVIRRGLKLELGLSNLQAENRVHTKPLQRIEIATR